MTDSSHLTPVTPNHSSQLQNNLISFSSTCRPNNPYFGPPIHQCYRYHSHHNSISTLDYTTQQP